MNAKLGIYVALIIFTLYYIVGWILAVKRAREEKPGDLAATRGWPGWFELALGAVTNFFDALGIGSFAPTTSVFKFKKMVPDERIPGTLNVGHTFPTLAQAFIFILVVDVEPATLIGMIVASVLGAWLGAGIVASWSRRKIQIGMGGALLAAALFFLMRNLDLFPEGGQSLSLEGIRLALGLAGNFMLGALMTLGIGLYAPCMILVSLLGMNPKAAFPIMMGSCAFLMPPASLRFAKKYRYSLRPALGLALGGIPAVLVAGLMVKELDVTTVRWLVVGVVLYTAVAMLRSAYVEGKNTVHGIGKPEAAPSEET
jgi:uncharacterized membrane protein YfcA